jgi:hypothetical protein
MSTPPNQADSSCHAFNQPTAPNPAIASRFHADHDWRRVGEPERCQFTRVSAKSHLAAAVVSALIAAIAAGVAQYCAWYRDTARITGEAVNFEAIERARFYATYCSSLAAFAFIVGLGFLLLYRSSRRRVPSTT